MARTAIAVILASALLVGCGGTEIRLKNEVQEVFVPMLYCPAPPGIERPSLPIHTMTAEQAADPGYVAKAYKASMVLLQGYAHELEQALDSYNEANAAYDELRTKFEGEWRKEFQDKIPAEVELPTE